MEAENEKSKRGTLSEREDFRPDSPTRNVKKGRESAPPSTNKGFQKGGVWKGGGSSPQLDIRGKELDEKFGAPYP